MAAAPAVQCVAVRANMQWQAGTAGGNCLLVVCCDTLPTVGTCMREWVQERPPVAGQCQLSQLVLPVLPPCKLTPEAARSAVTESSSDRVEQKVAARRDLKGRREQGAAQESSISNRHLSRQGSPATRPASHTHTFGCQLPTTCPSRPHQRPCHWQAQRARGRRRPRPNRSTAHPPPHAAAGRQRCHVPRRHSGHHPSQTPTRRERQAAGTSRHRHRCCRPTGHRRPPQLPGSQRGRRRRSRRGKHPLCRWRRWRAPWLPPCGCQGQPCIHSAALRKGRQPRMRRREGTGAHPTCPNPQAPSGPPARPTRPARAHLRRCLLHRRGCRGVG